MGDNDERENIYFGPRNITQLLLLTIVTYIMKRCLSGSGAKEVHINKTYGIIYIHDIIVTNTPFLTQWRYHMKFLLYCLEFLVNKKSRPPTNQLNGVSKLVYGGSVRLTPQLPSKSTGK